MPTVGQKLSAAAMDLITAICCCGPGRSTRKCARSAHRERLQAEFGERRADQMVNETRNLCLYPNVYLMDQFSTQIRVIRPIAVDKTEVTIWCFAPKGESDQARALRIRQYEDFFNVSGMGTPDDLEEFSACQRGYLGENLPWSDLSRGALRWVDGADEHAQHAGFSPRLSW